MSASEAFVRAYIGAALWSSNDDKGVPLDSNYDISDLSEATAALMRKDCNRFIELHDALLGMATCRRNGSGCSKDEQAGHDFWFNRNGHGVGFWDGDWTPRATGNSLSAECKKFGEFHLYVGDDGKVHGE